MDRYESLGVVGEGSYGVVLKCKHKDSGQVVAVKKFLESEDDPNVKKIALREVRMLKKLRHENLVNLIEFFRRKKRLYLVFEFVDHTILDELESSDNGLDSQIAREHIFQVIRGVAFCHQNNIIHRDVKPENVLVSKTGVVKLCDFGFARTLEGPNESCTDYVATRWYRAPELLVGDTKYGREVDIWAIGCLLSEILSGEPLFPGESDIDQLFHIIQTLGGLSVSHQSLVSRNPMFDGLRLPTGASTPLEKVFPKWSPRILEFVSECLDLKPKNRPTAEELLKHHYFTHDNFPTTFLPELKKRVKEEFSSSTLIRRSSTRKASGDSESISKRGKNGTSPLYAKPERKFPFTEKLVTQTPTESEGRSLNLKAPTIASSNQLPICSQPTSMETLLNTINQTPITSSITNLNSHQTHFQQQAIAKSSRPNISNQQPVFLSSKPSINYINLSSNNNTNRSNLFPFNEGPISLTSSQIPVMKDYKYIGGITSKVTAPVQSSQISATLNEISQNSSAINLQLATSPSRRQRKEEKLRNIEAFPWSPPSSKSTQTMFIRGQAHNKPNVINISLQPSSGIKPQSSKDQNIFQTNPNTSTGSPVASFSRHNQYDFSRHPYTVSLDRNKDPPASIRAWNRDPLKEIKENRKENKTFFSGQKQDKREFKPKRETTQWFKPKLFNEDLYLPSLLAVPGKSNSPTLALKEDLKFDDRGKSIKKNIAKRKDFSMPSIDPVRRSSVSSNESEALRASSTFPLL